MSCRFQPRKTVLAAKRADVKKMAHGVAYGRQHPERQDMIAAIVKRKGSTDMYGSVAFDLLHIRRDKRNAAYNGRLARWHHRNARRRGIVLPGR